MSMTFKPVQLNTSSIKQKSLDEKNHIIRNKISTDISGKKGY
jgi:hypothetical protein